LDWLKMKPNNLASRLSSKGSTSVEFVWGVPLRPFSWQDGKRGPEEKKFERFLTTSQVGGSDWQGTYRPFDDYKGLFISFAGLTPDEGHIADFANKYGCLLPGYDPDTRIWLLEEGSQNPISARGETREFWQREILAMSLAFNIWTGLRSGSSKLLASIFNAIAPDSPIGSLFNQWLNPNHPEVDAVAQVLARLVDQHLQEHVASRMRPSDEPLALKLSYVPRNLLGALWLQLALAIDAKKNFVKCAYCGDPLEVSDDGRAQRSDTRYCRPVCRVNAYRERVGQAQKLHHQNISNKEIAKKLGTTTERIKKWVSLAT
jgi:hypothetical protein